MQEPDVIILEASEIASMSARTVEVFLDGSKPRIVEWLVIEPSQAIAQGFSDHFRSFLKSDDRGKQVFVTAGEGRPHHGMEMVSSRSADIPPTGSTGVPVRCHWPRRTFRVGFEWDLERDFEESKEGSKCAGASDNRPGKAPWIRLRLRGSAKSV